MSNIPDTKTWLIVLCVIAPILACLGFGADSVGLDGVAVMKLFLVLPIATVLCASGFLAIGAAILKACQSIWGIASLIVGLGVGLPLAYLTWKYILFIIIEPLYLKFIAWVIGG